MINRTFLLHAMENAIGSAAAGAAAVLSTSNDHHILLTDLPFADMASGAVVGALLSLLYSFSSLRVDNGSASHLLSVVGIKRAQVKKVEKK